MLKKSGKFSNYKLPKKEAVATLHNPCLTNKKAREELGIHFTPVEKTIVGEYFFQIGIPQCCPFTNVILTTDMAEALISLGIVPRN